MCKHCKENLENTTTQPCQLGWEWEPRKLGASRRCHGGESVRHLRLKPRRKTKLLLTTASRPGSCPKTARLWSGNGRARFWLTSASSIPKMASLCRPEKGYP